MNSSNTWTKRLLIGLAFGSICAQPVFAGPPTDHCCVDWRQLNLSQEQNTQIQDLEDKWAKQYNEIRPLLVEDQQKLTRLLADHNSDPVEVMMLQQQIASQKEKLNREATANYLAKRKVLNDQQKFALEQMIRDVVRKRQNQMYPGSQSTDVANDRIQNLMNRVRNIWPVQSER